MIPCVLVADLPADEERAARKLGLGPEQLFGHGEGELRATVDVPAGEWLFWPAAHTAAWIGQRPAARPPQAPWLATAPADALLRMLRAGVWCQELELLLDDEWTIPDVPERALRQLVEERSRVRGISALLSTDEVPAGRLEILSDGRIWAEDSDRAVRWLRILALT